MTDMNNDHYQYLPISREKQEKIDRYKREVAGLEKIPIRCPRCHVTTDMVYADATGHKDIRCWKCKYVFVTSLPYFRTLRRKNCRNRW